ncbi:MAG TPA: fibronectin type III domain-containing protein [Spirochaetia bacterium]|nr:fibronectin type III domain-containing protein [Spirochaetia bacterium]
MKARSHVVLFGGAAALAMVVLGCSLNSAGGGAAPSAAAIQGRSVLPGTTTPAASLLLPQGTAFAVLGHSCGGIQEKSYATGFDSTTGLPGGDVYIQTRCGGSGRGGGYHTTTYSAWVGASWDFTGKLVSSAVLTAAPTVDPAFTATDGFGDTLSNISNVAYLVVPVPGAPTDVAAVQSGDQLQVTWSENGVNPAAVTSSTLTATPVGSTAATLTANVTGSATGGLLGPLEPQTTYSVTVVSATVGGTSAASAPVTVTTGAASVAPSAPTGVTARWAVADPSGSTDTLIAAWTAAEPGDSPVDQYEATITGSDGGGTFDQVVDGSTLTAYFGVDFTPNWTLTVRAHNAVGWGPWSAPVRLGGL